MPYLLAQPKAEAKTETLPAVPDSRQVTGLDAVVVALPALREPQLPAKPVTKSEALELVRAKPAGGPPPKYGREANERWRFLKSVQEHLKDGECESIREACEHIVILHRDDYEILGAKKLATAKKARSNYNNWMTLLGTHANGRPNWDNVAGLMPRYARGERGRAGDPLCWEVLAGIFEEQSGIKLAHAHRLMEVAARRSNIPANEIPSASQVQRWYREHASPAQIAFARKGEVHALNRLIGHVHRDWSKVAPNKCWFADHHRCDIFVKIPDGKGGWKADRPWLTGWMDAKSWALLGWAIRMDEPNTLVVMQTLLDAIWRNGMHCATTLYTDNGKDFLAMGLGTPYVSPTGAELTCLPDLGVTRVIRSKPYNGRAKPIERLFGIFCEHFAKVWPSYTGNTPSARPDKAHYYHGNPDELPTLGQLVAFFREWLPAYHARPNKGKILDGKTPAKVWTAGPGGPQLSIGQLKLGLCLPVDVRTVGPGGSIRISNLFFQSRKLWSIIGQKVVIRVDGLHGRAWACKLDGEPITELELIPQAAAIAETAEEKAVLATLLREQELHRQAFEAAVQESTGGLVGLAAIEILQIDFSKPYQIEEVGRVRSVKGPGHTFVRKIARQGETHTGFALPKGQDADAVQAPGNGVAERLQKPRIDEAEARELAEYREKLNRSRQVKDDGPAEDGGGMSLASFQAALHRARKQEGDDDE
ncbi:MAG: hypothetical protein HN849_35500 [Victivallales bacterium]|nr:hypothetical protein [Victivallales bacterium]MBT7304888.1 hypothetical protein [Victivallales bacterium]